MAGSGVHFRLFLLMPQRAYIMRPGATLLELLLFVAFFALSSGILLAFFFMTSEQRVRQQTIATVEQSGVQMLQAFGYRIRNAERILDPVPGASGGILTLQMSDSELHPTVLGLSGAALYLGEADVVKRFSVPDVIVSGLRFHNTSPSSDRPSVLVQFDVTRTVTLTTPISYTRRFEALLPLFPDDTLNPACSCPVPSCSAGLYSWQYCVDDACTDAPVSLPCP